MSSNWISVSVEVPNKPGWRTTVLSGRAEGIWSSPELLRNVRVTIFDGHPLDSDVDEVTFVCRRVDRVEYGPDGLAMVSIPGSALTSAAEPGDQP